WCSAVPVHSGVGTDGRSRPAVQLRVAGKSLLQAWHTDQHHANLSTVVEIAQLLEAGCFESVGFVHQEQVGWLASHGCVWIAVPRGPCTDAIDGPPQIADGVLHSAWGVGDARRVQQRSPWPAVARWRRAVSIRRWAPEQRLQLVPACILTSRHGLADTRQPIPQADVACFAAG